MDLMEYNTTRSELAMREYGRHIQKMIEHLLSIEDPERRQRNAHAVIELMGFLNPHLKNVEDFRHKLWDHLFLISEFKLEDRKSTRLNSSHSQISYAVFCLKKKKKKTIK